MRLTAGDRSVSGEKCDIWYLQRDGQIKDTEFRLLYNISLPVKELWAEQRPNEICEFFVEFLT